MDAIGRYDFGANLRAIDFGGWLGEFNPSEVVYLEFWLKYWTADYAHIAIYHDSRTRLVDFDSLCEFPESELERIAKIADLDATGPFVAHASRLKSPKCLSPMRTLQEFLSTRRS